MNDSTGNATADVPSQAPNPPRPAALDAQLLRDMFSTAVSGPSPTPPDNLAPPSDAPATDLPAPTVMGLLARALDVLPDSIVLFDTDLRYRWVARNSGLPGLTPADMIGQCVTDLLPFVDHGPDLDHIRGALSSQTTQEWMTHYPGTRLWFELRAIPLGEGFVAVQSRDVSTRELAVARVESLLTLAEALGRASTRVEVAQAVCDVAFPILGLVGGGVAVIDDAREHLEVLARIVPDAVAALWPDIPLSADIPICKAAHTGHLQRALVTEVREPRAAEAMRMYGASRVIAVPLVSGGEVLGAISLSYGERSRSDNDDEGFLVTMASMAAEALRRAGAAEKAIEVASVLQSALLPGSLPQVPGLEVVARYQPAADGGDVGGDWFDTMQVPGGRVAFVCGDVMGRGVRAAAVMGQVRNVLQGAALADPHPAAVLTVLDRLFLTLPEDEIATVAYVLYDPVTHGVTVGNAGHVPPLMVRADGSAGFLDDGAGPLLGLPVPPRRACRGTVLRPGDRLVLCTDGLVERRDQDLVTGMAALTQRVLAGSQLPASALADDLITMAAQDDDTTVLVVHRVS